MTPTHRTTTKMDTGRVTAFDMGDLQLFQFTFARGMANDIPRTREHLYAEGY